ncbi:MAG: hypothetical protein LAO51_08880 [Acidobacteriia bacterium]|nr:hypothetical protein [Terriglobia bacterium]
MRVRRFALACSVLFVAAIVWNGLVHLVLLRRADAVVRHLYRPDLADRTWALLSVTAGVVVLFAWGYSRFARVGSIREGMGYGVFFALLAGVLVDLNPYVLFPIPGRLAAAWFLGGIVEFVVYGIILSRFHPLAG